MVEMVQTQSNKQTRKAKRGTHITIQPDEATANNEVPYTGYW